VPVARRYRCGDGFRLGLRLRMCLAQGPERHQIDGVPVGGPGSMRGLVGVGGSLFARIRRV
jgi:hypothetical protein